MYPTKDLFKMKKNYNFKIDFALIGFLFFLMTINFPNAIGNSETLNNDNIESAYADSIPQIKSGTDTSKYKSSQEFEKNRTKSMDNRDSIKFDDKDPGGKDTIPH